MSSQLPLDVTQWKNWTAMTLDSSRIIRYIAFMVVCCCWSVKAQRADETAMNGTVIFQSKRAPIVNGENVVTNERTLEGSKLLRLAKLPLKNGNE